MEEIIYNHPQDLFLVTEQNGYLPTESPLEVLPPEFNVLEELL